VVADGIGWGEKEGGGEEGERKRVREVVCLLLCCS
jgi:hypothetical protein